FIARRPYKRRPVRRIEPVSVSYALGRLVQVKLWTVIAPQLVGVCPFAARLSLWRRRRTSAKRKSAASKIVLNIIGMNLSLWVSAACWHKDTPGAGRHARPTESPRRHREPISRGATTRWPNYGLSRSV